MHLKPVAHPEPGTRSSADNAISKRVRSFFAQKLYISLFLPLIILGLWQTASTYQWVEPIFLPKPASIISAFWYMLQEQELLNDIQVSVSIVAQGFLYGSLAAIALSLAAGMSRRVELFFSSTVNTLRHIPTVAWLPLIVVWLGLGAPAKILIIAKSVFFPVFLNTLQGIRNIDKSYIELANVLTLSKWQIVRKVVFPSILPAIAVSLRYSAGLAWAIVVVAEGLSGLEGLGFLIFRSQQLLMTDQLVVCMILIGAIGFVIDRAMFKTQQRLLRWKAGFDA
ncbi:ABC transporter permease [Betaproteobacteria bacterium]|nr:ABC transporter permease [Betaproteobacteria bacterium]GHU08073.1 ABC transporter permease [Betaproteobacteria bacterium]GHU23088.1 ABC transporter permease [Betaproteobacteria bacterium]GHU28250.1 ABC transporter permease [Betaproteobacteria bacterium]